MNPQIIPLPESLESFRDRIRREFVEGSAIDPSLFDGAIDLIEDTGFWEPNRALNHHVSIFYQTKRPHSYGAIAAFMQETGELWQAKPQYPRMGEDGDPIKYEYPLRGELLRALLPPVNRETRQAIAQRYGVKVPPPGQAFWDWLELHPEIPIVLTEGGKKSLCLLSLGYVAIALVGVHGGVLKNEKIGGVKLPRIHPELIPDLARFAVEGRQITLAFDQDVKPKTRYSVEAALGDLAFHLEQRGAAARIAAWDGQNGHCKGVDDLIVAEGQQAWENAYRAALPAPVWRILRGVKRRVRRKPNLNLGNEGFTAALGKIRTTGILALVGGKGTEKSTFIGRLLQQLEKPWLSYTFLQSLARDQAGGWGGVFINDGDRHQGTLLNHQGEPVRGGSVCWPSALSVSEVGAKIVILDEVTASLKFLHGSPLSNQNGIRPLLEAEFVRRIEQAELVILSDADGTEEVIAAIEKIRGERAFLAMSERKSLTWPCNLLDGTRNQAIADFHEAAQNIPDGKILLFHSDSRALVESLSRELEANGKRTLLITQQTSGGEIEREFLHSKGTTLPDLVRMGIKVILCSPSVTQGFSIERETHLIDSVWGIYTGGSIEAESIAQTLDRLRSLVQRTVWLPVKGRAISRLSTATTAKAVLKDLETSSKVSLRLARLSLQPESLALAEGIDYGRENLKLLAEFEACRNRGVLQLRHTVWALLENEGKQVTVTPCRSSREVAKALARRLRESKRQQEIERADRIAAGIPLTQEEAEAIERQLQKNPESITEQDCEALERFYISQFYRVEEVDQALVLWDGNGKKRQCIRNLEHVLNPDAATAKTAAAIDRNPTNPQDWDKAALRSWLLIKTGAADLIKAVCEGSITHMDKESIAPIAANIQQYPEEFRIAFGMRNINRITPMQAIAWLLDWCGVTRISHKQRREGKLVNLYEIDQQNLERLKEIVRRRSQADPPPLEINKHEGGGSSIKSQGIPAEWQSPQALEEIRSTWALADNPQAIAELQRLIPPNILELALAG